MNAPTRLDASLAPSRTSEPPLRECLVSMRRELLAHAWRLTRSVAASEDLVQDTIERALRFESYYEKGTNLRAWVHQIMANLFYSRCRSGRREARALGVLHVDPCAWTRGSSNDVVPSLSKATRKAINSLPEQFQSTVVMVDLMELSYRDAADRLGVPVGTVMSRLHRGRRLLADALREAA